ncbi:MAG: hypothetical protein ACJASC_001208 [Limimaricola cinnabarinus]|jgi:hypothetical protein|uniref:hypothetical protein n=1 Tax=Limimaricola cinnabarinus TaxID=1125964 RepID=UPI0039E4AB9B
MNPWLSKFLLVSSILSLTSAVIWRPDWVSDENAFLREFIDHDYLSFLGLVLTITVASLSQLHLSLDKLKSQLATEEIDPIRREIKHSAVVMIMLFAASLLLIVAKPIILDIESAAAIINSACIFFIIFYLLVLSDITLAIFDFHT